MTTKTILAILALTLGSSTTLVASPATGAGDELYQIRVSLSFEEGLSGATLQTEPDQDVPAGKLLLIRNANSYFRLPAGQTGACRLLRFGGLDLFFIPGPTAWVYDGSGDYTGHGNVRTEYYLDEGDFTVACARSAGAGKGSAVVTITGSLVDAD